MSWRVKQKLRRMLTTEVGTVYKPFGAGLSVALVYPNTYYVGMSNLGLQAIYHELNRRSDTTCERVFLPEEGEPYSLESQRSLKEFDIVSFSISFEMDYINVLNILDSAGIPLRSKERDESFPLIMAGGICSTFNPEPLAEFVDLFVIGEGEEVVHEVLDFFKKSFQSTHPSRRELLKELTQIKGVYVPQFYEVIYEKDGRIREIGAKEGVPQKVRRRWINNINSYDTVSRILSPHTEFGGMYLIEISRGCSRGCRFCLAGFSYLPPRFRNLERIIKLAKEGLKYREKIGLLGPAVSDYPRTDELCYSLRELGAKISVASLRVDTLTEPLAEALAAGGEKTITFAIEAATESMRTRINKGISFEEILKALNICLEKDILNVKLYFMIGLPGETMEEIKEIVELAKKIKENVVKASRRRRRLGRVTLSISPFVPKPHTPFQWGQMLTPQEISQRLKYLKRMLAGESNLIIVHESPKWSFLQGVLARGDRRIGEALYFAHKLKGDWREAFRQAALGPEFYALRERELEEILPWEHLEMGVKKDYLWEEFQRSKEGLKTPPCKPPDCRRCGVCSS